MSRVYLAGPIAGQSYGGAVSWREYAVEKLADAGIVAILAPYAGQPQAAGTGRARELEAANKRLTYLLGHVLKNGRLEDDEMADARAALADSGPAEQEE